MTAAEALSPMEMMVALMNGLDIVLMDSENHPHLVCGVKTQAMRIDILTACPDWTIISNPLTSGLNRFEYFYIRIPGPKDKAKAIAALREAFPGLTFEE